jgi:hypothetical protein
MALVNPNIAMSFRQPEFRPRNALAEYAQIQQIMGGQRQAEMADMQLEDLRRNRATLNNIRQAIVAKGGPPDLGAAADEMIRSGNPDYMNQGIAIRDALQKQQRLDLYERQFGGAAGASATPTSAAGAITASAPAAAPEGELVAAPITPPMGTMREIAPDGAAGAEMPLTRGANALAPAAAPASTNAMTAAQPAAPAQDVNALMRRYNLASRAGSPDAPVILKQIEAALRGDQNRPFVVGNRLVSPTGQELYVGPQGTASLPVSIAEFERAKTDPAFMQFLQDRAAAIRPPAAPRQEPAPRTQRVELSDGSLGIMNMDTGAVTRATVGGAPAKARPSAFAEKTQAQRVQLERDLTTAITELKDAAKPGGLIDQSTGSGVGRGIDIGARLVGKAMPGDIAIGKLAPIADLVLKMVPRFEGPQSDKDTKSYKEAAGQLSDAGLPREIRKQAANIIVRLMENRKGQFVTKEMAAEGAAPTAAAPALPPGFTRD